MRLPEHESPMLLFIQSALIGVFSVFGMGVHAWRVPTYDSLEERLASDSERVGNGIMAAIRRQEALRNNEADR